MGKHWSQKPKNSNHDWKQPKNGTFFVNAGELLQMQDIVQNDIKLGNT